ncbi:PRA1 family protein h-like [Trifolium pratense]|uniref:PRA1 family protein h-like n=1 Tax=Trifolium pratense TaxID=57577 RepID=A0A2K3LC57_TRIPR|nr:PRA1 family protein h-like [Trifolium pratense]
MVFSSNPLALSVPEPAFESWLRDTGYLEIIDQRTSDAADATAATTTINSSPLVPATSFSSKLLTLLSFITLNPFAKLTADDFSSDTPSWSRSFIGSYSSYSFPSSPSQARFRVHENVKRYARNYAYLFIVFFASALGKGPDNPEFGFGRDYAHKFSNIAYGNRYKMPLALVGLISCLALWDFFKFCSDRWGLDQYPVVRQCLLRIAQLGEH